MHTRINSKCYAGMHCQPAQGLNTVHGVELLSGLHSPAACQQGCFCALLQLEITFLSDLDMEGQTSRSTSLHNIQGHGTAT